MCSSDLATVSVLVPNEQVAGTAALNTDDESPEHVDMDLALSATPTLTVRQSADDAVVAGVTGLMQQRALSSIRLLSKDVRFKDLGLLVVDEEQRFDVAHKEKIKQVKKGVDVLTLSATPIPRT